MNRRNYPGFLKRRAQGVFYFGCIFPLTFASLSVMIGVSALRRLFRTRRTVSPKREKFGTPRIA